MYRVVVHRQAARYLGRLPAPQKERIKKALSQLALDPFNNADVKAMMGPWTGYNRLRIGNERIIFWIDKTEKVIYVDHIGPRGDIYKQ
jgi:mRNA interferase RelE/StbE